MRTVVLDDELAALLEQEKPLDQAARETIVMDSFRRGKISTGKACELLSLDRVAFARRTAELDIAYFQMTKEDWEAEKEPSTHGSSRRSRRKRTHRARPDRLTINIDFSVQIA